MDKIELKGYIIAEDKSIADEIGKYE